MESHSLHFTKILALCDFFITVNIFSNEKSNDITCRQPEIIDNTVVSSILYPKNCSKLQGTNYNMGKQAS